MYRPSSKPPVGAWAKHLQEQRRQRGLSATQAFELIYERMGLSPKSRAVYTALDTGPRQPSEEYAAVLAAEFGWPPSVDAEPAPEPTLAVALSALVMELQASRLERQTLEARLRAVEAELQSRRAPRGGAGSQGQSTLEQTAG